MKESKNKNKKCYNKTLSLSKLAISRKQENS